MQHTPFGIIAYRFATRLLAPAAPLLLKRRIARGKENGERTGERLGYASRPRPAGTLLWVHGASVGECAAALPLIGEMIARTGCHVLVTSGTVTSAALMKERLPDKAFHQFVPVDIPGAVTRFCQHWRPQVGLFVDSDIWPNLVMGAGDAGTKLALINARMSKRSFEGWKRAPETAKVLLSRFEACLAQDEEIAARFRALGAGDVRVAGSLKADAPPLPADARELETLRQAIGSRPVFLAAQTHSGEEETLLPAHDLLRREFPGLLTIIVPRHPERGAAIAELCGTRKTARRSRHEEITADTAVYIADTMGELGLFYRLAPFAFVGGSLIPHGGQNPLEPARLGCAVLAGPHTFNFNTAYEAIISAQDAGRVLTSTDIRDAASALFADPARAKAMGEAAKAGAEKLCGAVKRTAEYAQTLLEKTCPDARA
jgi:3-deoxy-D-manno-octulosonic-acid transferase